MTTGAIKRAKLQSNHHQPTTQHPVFLQAGCPSCRPTNSVRAAKKIRTKTRYYCTTYILHRQAVSAVSQHCCPLVSVYEAGWVDPARHSSSRSILVGQFSSASDLLHRTMSTVWISLCFSLRFNGHFPGEPGLAGVYRSKGWWRWWWQLDYWSYKSCKAPAKSSPINQHRFF